MLVIFHHKIAPFMKAFRRAKASTGLTISFTTQGKAWYNFIRMILDLVSTNVYSSQLSSKLLISGTCLLAEWPEIIEKLGKDKTIMTVCLESVHLNTAIEKIASILAKGNIEEISVVTKDGSPHCIGLHYAVEWAVKMTKSNATKVEYYVIEHGVLHHIPEKKIKEKRHLSR